MTLGAEGALVASAAQGVVRVPSVKVAAVDTTGAGGAFRGGAGLAARRTGESLAEAAAYAARWARRQSRRGARWNRTDGGRGRGAGGRGAVLC